MDYRVEVNDLMNLYLKMLIEIKVYMGYIVAITAKISEMIGI